MDTKQPPNPPGPMKPPAPAAPSQGRAFTNATAPKAPQMEVVLRDDQIVAKPLRLPDFINIKHNNPNMSMFWGNRSVGDKESKMRYSQLIAMGFLPAQPNECHLVAPDGRKLPVPDALAIDGRILWGDLIALKIPRVDYIGVQKWNAQTAENRVRKPGMMADISKGASNSSEDADKLATSSVSDITRSPRLAGKVSFYEPSKDQAAALTGAVGDKDKDI